MADQNYDTKLASLRRYIPFLVNMMTELKAKGNRDAQLNKIQSLHDMITDTRKKLKLETLNRCEEVLTNIYYKVNPQHKNKGLPHSRTLPGLEDERDSTTLPGIESPQSTPASPSPTRDIFPTKPVTIPTEKIYTPSCGLGSLPASKSHRPKINVYSNVVIHPPRDTSPSTTAKVPDMSKPPISLDDLKTLEDDVQQKISDAKFANASVDDLQAYRKEIELQLRIDSVTSTMSPIKSSTRSINTTVRNNPSLSKKLSFTESKSKGQESSPKASRNVSPKKATKTLTSDKKPPKDNEDTVNVSKDSTPNKSSQKVVTESSSIFGSMLSSIDNKILGDKKNVKKGDRRSSITLSKNDDGSTTSLSSNKSDTKESEAKTELVEDKSTEAKDRKNIGSHKHRRSSLDKEKHKHKEKSKNKSKDGPVSEKDKDKKKSKKEKHRSKESKHDKRSSHKGDNEFSETNAEKDERKIGNAMLLSDILYSKSKFCSDQNTKSASKEISSSTPTDDINTHLPSTTLDPRKEKSDTISASSSVVENSQLKVSQDLPKTATVYKRLADKYNPKPKSKPAEIEIPDVDKAVSDSIEKFMKVSPARPVLTSLSGPKSVLGGNVFETTTSQSNTPGLHADQSKPVQLPEILQRIFSKPLLGDIIPKRLNENMFPLTAAAQNKIPNLGINSLTKPGAIQPPEPPILSPPRRSLSFQSPDVSRNSLNFISPPHGQEFAPSHEMGVRPNLHLPIPGTQRGLLPTPPIPPLLPREVSDRNHMMDCSFANSIGTPRMDFDTPSTPMPDFESPRVDFEPPSHIRNEFNPNQRFIAPVHQERQMNCFDPRNQNFMGQPQFQPQPEVNIFNNQLIPNMGYYGANHQMSLLNTDGSLYRHDQNFYQERAWCENARWSRDRRPGDPRSYREYKEMKDRQEREAKAAQEKQKEIKDPRLVPRESKDAGEKDIVRDKSMGDKPEVIIRDPRLSRGREKSVDRDLDLKERARSRERAISRLKDSSDSKDSRSRTTERESRFDKMYSRTNSSRPRSQSRPRDDKDDEEESFISPLDSLYNAGEKGKTGRGYGVQNFKIPRKSRIDDVKRADEKKDERRSSTVGKQKRYLEIIDSSDESDTNDADDNSVPEIDSDAESVKEDKFEKLKDLNKKSKDKITETVKKTEDKTQSLDVDTSRIKVVIKSSTNDEIPWQGDIKSSDNSAEETDFSNFVSEYDKEFELENRNKLLDVTESEQNIESDKSIKEAATAEELNLQVKEPDVQVEEPTSSQDVIEAEIVENDLNKVVEAGNSNKNDMFKGTAEFIEADSSKKKGTAEFIEADSSKKSDGTLTPQENTVKSDEPSEQNILAHFFENLLKSKNKKDKKTALFSLIETFSDSFDTKEIQKIRKIIKVNEDEEEESDEEEKEPKVVEQKYDNNDRPVDITQTSVAIPIQDELPVVGSTTEEIPPDNIQESKDTSAAIEPLENAETQVNEVTKSSEEVEQSSFEETKSEESLIQSDKSEFTDTLEPVLVSVGERIKNRRRNLTPPKARKKGKTELDMLHEDIQDMFIRDGVLTATGKRMCRILKDDPTVLTTTVSKPEILPEQPKKVRKKPGPKPKSKTFNKDETHNSIKDMSIIIRKMPDNIINANTVTTRQLRNRNRLSSYAESDDDSQKSTNDITQHKLRKRNLQGSYAESDDDSQKSNDNIDTVPEDEFVRSEIGESSSESEDEDNKSQTSEGVPKPRVLRRRRGAKWASGIIPKFKKKKPQSKSLENSPYPSRSSSPNANDNTITEPDFDKLVEPDKEYYYDYTNKKKIICKLCKYSGHLLTGHYLKEHPQSEVLCSRLPPSVASEAIKDFLTNGKRYESIINKKISIKYHYCCRVCGFTSFTSPIFFYEHVTTHTGEYRHQCGICEYFAVTGKTMAGHFLSVHPDQEKKAIRRPYTLAIVFGYICGECNFLQLKEKSVEDHANIFHLGEKPTIYKISMSTILDPVFNNVDVDVDNPKGDEKVLEPKLTNITISSTENDAANEGVTENEAIEATALVPKKRRKPDIKSKLSNKESTAPIRKKPGPKSKTMPIVAPEPNTVKEKITEVPSLDSVEQVTETTPAAPARKKPGPKSRTQKSRSQPIENLPSVEKETVSTPQEISSERPYLENDFIKEAPTRKRRRSLDKLISEDSGDDLDTIITLSSRSSRAAKEKATAKLKTLMESNEGLSTRKRADTDATRKEKEIDTEKSLPNEDLEQSDHQDEAEVSNENIPEDTHLPGISSEKDLNVFTCKTDILEEEAKKIEEERLRKMEELNKSIGSRTSKLDFTDKLSNRLSNEQTTETPTIRVKQEPKDDYPRAPALRVEAATMPVLEKQLPLPVTKTPPLIKVSKSPLANKKPVLEEHNLVPQSSINFRQNKPNSLFFNMIEKLQGKVNEAAVQQQGPSTGSNFLNEDSSSSNSQLSKTSEVLISIGDLITATRRDNEIIYSCHANNCYVVTKDKMVFQLHCKFGHKDLVMTSSLCEKCGVVIDITPDTSLLENLYDHLVFAHSDCIAQSSSLRMRRLSGDKLSVKQELAEKQATNRPSKEKDGTDFEARLDKHILSSTHKESLVPAVTTYSSSETNILSTAAEAAKDALTMETESSRVSAPTTMSNNIEIPNEESMASEATLELAEDNPFSFKIANVVSLAKSTGPEDYTQSPSGQKKVKQEPLPALIKPVPPLTLIGIPKQQPSTQQNPLIVKEAKLTLADLSRPKKAPKALQKFVDTPGDLYKCPHFYCMFSTNVRTLLERHLKVHKCDTDEMIRCVYCDMKTPWEHVPMHIDIRHANCRFACSYCLYRACLKEYVCLHQEQAHPDKDFIVLALPQHKAAKKFSIADAQIDCKVLCEPFRCICKGEVVVDGKLSVKEYLFENEFSNHLNSVHQNKFASCGYPGCTHTVNSSLMLNHWAMFHGICTYQCGYCKTSSKEITRIYTHFSQMHPSSLSDILVRVNDNLPKDRELGYSKEAFQKLGHIRKIPQNLLSAIGKRSQRSIKLVYFAGSGEETATSEGTSPASPTGGTEKLYLVPAAMVSPNKGQSVTSTAPISKVVAQTTSVTTSGKSVLEIDSTVQLPRTTVAAISTSNLPQMPVKIGNKAIHPLGKGTNSAVTGTSDTTTSSSHATIAVLSRSLIAGSSVMSSQRSPKTACNKSEKPQSTGLLISNILSRFTPLVPKTTITSIESHSKDSVDQGKGSTIDSGFMGPIIEETTSQDSSTGLSEDDILQSAIQSILDADDLSESNSNMSAHSNNVSNKQLLETNSENTSKPNQEGVFVDVGVLESSPNISRSATPELSPISKTGPPPLVLISKSSKPVGSKMLSQTQDYPFTTTGPTAVQEKNETIPVHVAPVEHVEVAGDVPDSSTLVSEDVDPLNIDALESNEDSNSGPPCFDDINVGLDSPPEDPLTITPTFNSDLPSTDDPLSFDGLAEAIDPLEVVEGQGGDNSASQSITENSPGPLLITSMRRSMSIVSNSDDESDSSSSEKGKKRGLIGYQLYRCMSCNLSFSNVQSFKSHVANSLRCKTPGTRQYQCVHCEKSLKTPQRLADHIQTHGVPRFTCSLCNEKFPVVNIAKLHMKNRHNIQQTNLIPLKSDRTSMDIDDFMVKPGHANQPTINKDKDSTFESPKHGVEENTFNPDQIDSIPIRQIFSTNVKCGKCNYQTKVRVNIVRHLQMHLEEKAVPDTAPVNPVPCLEKNEKMFDKMFNLAASSITTGATRMGGANQEKEKEEEKYPEFVPSHRRFVCSAHGCSYLCPEEANLKHHLAALHSDDPGFMCSHCKTKIEPTDPESVVKHLKLHGLHLYKCHYCTFVHHLKHKVERHITDGHLDAVVKVVTVRNMESEPKEFGNTEDVATPPATSTTKFKPWRCCMCKVKCHTKEDIQQHIVHRHDIDTQYKCTLCAFKNDNENSFRDHFKETHPNHDIDVIFIYQKVEEEIPKDHTSATPFDTTPLWQRDKPRVRHIRGILFDESSPQPTKSPKKPPKAYAGSTSKAGSSSSNTISPSSSSSKGVSKNLFDCIDNVARGPPSKIFNIKNMFDCIDAVARGTDSTVDTAVDKKNVATTSSGGVVTADLSKGSTLIVNEKISSSGKKDYSKKVSQIKDKLDVSDPFDSGNDDVIEVTQTASIIVIDSDSDTEPPPAPKTDDSPKTKDIKPKSSPQPKGIKRQNTTDLLHEAVKMAKIEEPDPDDEDSIMATNCTKDHLISIYGPFGAPHNKQWKCPKCQQFKSKRVADFMFHIYKDFNVYRYKCKACSDLSITYKYMLDHITLHPGFTEDIIETLAPNVKLETWVHMVIREQSAVILKNSPLMKKRPLTGPTDICCYFCNEKFMSMPDCCEHMLYHWVMMPYQCQHCPHEFYTVFDLKHHHKIEHPDLKLYLDPKGPTLGRALQCIEQIKKRPAPKGALQSSARKKAKTEDIKETKVDAEPVTSGIVVNKPPWVRRGPKSASASPSPKSTSSTPSSSTADVIRIDDDDDDLVIVSKTEETVVNDDEVFACEACAYVADTEVLIIKHLHIVHGIESSRYHSLSKKRSEIPSTQDMACNICDKVFSELKLRQHFLENHLQSHTFIPYRFKCELCLKRYLTFPKVKMHFTRCHPGVTVQCHSLIQTPGKAVVASKNKLFSCTMCSYTNTGPNAATMRAHLRGHLRPIVCNRCNVRFRYHSEVQTHNAKEHPDLELDFTTLEEVQKEFTETLKVISSRATAVSQTFVVDKRKVQVTKVKNVARKSTSAPFMSPSTHSDDDKEEGYGISPKEFNLSAITTTFELDGLEYTTTAEQMMKMFNMDTFVDVSECAVDIMPVDKS